MRLAVVQTCPAFGEVESNIQEAIALMNDADASFFVLPELFNTGYNFIDRQEVEKLAEDASGFTFQTMAEFSKKKSCYVVYGFAEKADRFYNSSALVGPEGLIGIYRKVHLYYRETLFFAPGNKGFPVFTLPFGKVGMMICFDWMYPESARSLALLGAQLIAHPSNLVMPYCPDAMVTRCLENKIYSATANRIGTEDRGGIALTYIGKSEIVTPGGGILTRLGENNIGVSTVDVDLNVSLNKKINEFNDLLNDRKPSEYFFPPPP